jgi:hypothetical protein
MDHRKVRDNRIDDDANRHATGNPAIVGHWTRRPEALRPRLSAGLPNQRAYLSLVNRTRQVSPAHDTNPPAPKGKCDHERSYLRVCRSRGMRSALLASQNHFGYHHLVVNIDVTDGVLPVPGTISMLKMTSWRREIGPTVNEISSTPVSSYAGFRLQISIAIGPR